jgi:ribosomal protein L23
MALFTKTTKEQTAVTSAAVVVQSSMSVGYAHVLRHARITEKATVESAKGVYVFDVDPASTKRQVISAVHTLYNVTPRKIAMVTIPTKKTRSNKTGKRGVTGGGKKAYVYLKKGETISIS